MLLWRGWVNIYVSRTLLSILSQFNSAVVWMVLSLSIISDSSCLFSKPLGTVPNAPTTTDIIVTFIFLGLFSSLARYKLSNFLFSFIFPLVSGTAKSSWSLSAGIWWFLWKFYAFYFLGHFAHCKFYSSCNWQLSPKCKYKQVFGTLLNVQADLKSVIV